MPDEEDGSDIFIEVVARDDLSTAGQLATLDDRLSASFTDVLCDSGGWMAALFNDDPALDSMGTSKFLNFYVRSRFGSDYVLAFTGMCEQFKRVIVATDEEPDETTTWSGSSHLAVLGEAVVYTDLALGVEPTPENRVFNYSSVFYQAMGADANDPSVTWVTPTAVCDVATAQSSWASGIVPWDADFAPGQETVVQVLWASDGTTDQATIGTCYFSQVIDNTLGGGVFRFQGAMDNLGEIFLDAQLIITCESGGNDFTNHASRDVYMSAGLHVISGWCANIPLNQSPAFGLNPAGYAWAIYEVNGDGQLGAFLTGSQAAVASNMVEYADHVPGMTPGMVMIRLLTEAQGTDLPYVGVRNDNLALDAFTACLTDLTWTFDELLDSNGETWPIYPDIATRVGTDYLTVLRELHAAGYIDFSLTPGTLELNMYIYGTLDPTVPGGVDYHRPTDEDDESTGNITSWEETGEVVQTTAMLVRYGPTWLHREKNSAITAYGRKEAMLSYGAAQSPGEAARLADADLDRFGAPRVETNITIDPQDDDHTPYVGYTPVGATITLEGVGHRILAMTVADADDDDSVGEAVFTPTLNDDIVLSAPERLALWEQQMMTGTLGGRSDTATPATPVFIQRPTVFPFFPVSSGTWTELLSSVILPREQDACCAVGGLYYRLVLGGGDKFYSYDPMTDTETVLDDPNILQNGHCLLVANGSEILLFNDTSWAPNITHTQRYDIGTDTWDSGSVLAPDPIPRNNRTGARIGGSVYVAAGATSTPDVESFALRIYDIAGDSWSSGASGPGGWYYYSAVAGGKLYLFGQTGLGVGVPDAWVYDPGLDSWTALTPPPIDYIEFVCTLADDQTILVGSESYDPNLFYYYDTVADAYTAVTSPPPGTNFANGSGALIGSTVYASNPYSYWSFTP